MSAQPDPAAFARQVRAALTARDWHRLAVRADRVTPAHPRDEPLDNLAAPYRIALVDMSARPSPVDGQMIGEIHGRRIYARPRGEIPAVPAISVPIIGLVGDGERVTFTDRAWRVKPKPGLVLVK